MELLILIIITLLSSAFFSGMEIAFVASNKFKIELDNKQGSLYAKILSYFIQYPSKYISTMLIGNNLALVIYGILMARVLEPKIENYTNSHGLILLIQTVISTIVILITAEFIPKTLFRLNPNRVLKYFSIIILIIYKVLSPLVYIIIWLSKMFLKKALKVDFSEDKPVFGKVDLDNYLKAVISSSKETEKTEELDHEIQIFQNALDFSSIRIRECQVPRTEIVAVEVSESIDILKKRFIETHLSKILVFKENIETIIGFVDSYQMFSNPKNIKTILNPVLTIPETMLASNLLSMFLKEHKSIAVVVDEFGGTSGLVTIEDIMEEIVGEIEDEHDISKLKEEKISDFEYVFSGRLEIDYLNEKYNFNIPVEEEYETLAGYIIHHYESIPPQKEEIQINSFNFKILAASKTKIDRVKLTILHSGAD